MSVVSANSKPGQSPGDLPYKTALRASVVGFMDAADAGAARAAVKRELWCLDPLHPGAGDTHACPDYQWNSLQAWVFDACTTSLGFSHAAIGAAVAQDDGFALLSTMLRRLEPRGLTAVKKVEAEMLKLKFEAEDDIHAHLDAVQSLINKYDRASQHPCDAERSKSFLLGSLPPSWSSVVSVWEVTPHLTFDALCELVRSYPQSSAYELMLEQNAAMVALSARGVAKCHHCGGNHYKRNCPELAAPPASVGSA